MGFPIKEFDGSTNSVLAGQEFNSQRQIKHYQNKQVVFLIK